MRFFKKCFLFALILIPAFTACSHKSAFVLDIPDFYPSEVLESSSRGVRYFAFTNDQRGAISNFFEKNGDASLMISLTPLKNRTSETDTLSLLTFGFFYDSYNKAEEVNSVPVVKETLQKYGSSSFCSF